MKVPHIFLVTNAMIICSHAYLQTPAPAPTPTDAAPIVEPVPGWSDYTSPIYSIDGSLFELNEPQTVTRVGVGNRKHRVTTHQLGSWLGQKATGRSFIIAAIFGEANSAALNKVYSDKIQTYISMLEKRLPKGVGQLVQCTYLYGDGVVDPESVRLSFKGIGYTPEEALAQAEIPQVGAAENEGSHINQKALHFIWIAKDTAGKMKMSIFRDHEVEILKQKSMQVELQNAKEDKYFEMYHDPALPMIDLAERARTIAERHEEHLAIVNRLDMVDKLNAQLQQAQQEMNELADKYNRIANQQNEVSTIIGFVEALTTINSFFDKGTKAPNNSSYKFQADYLNALSRSVNDDMKKERQKIRNYLKRLNNAYRESNIPEKIELP